LETIVSNDYTPFDSGDFESETTLILGARCVDGVALIGDRKLTQTDSSGMHDAYDDKITGEIDGILTGFSGDAGAFEVFRSTLRDYVTTTRNEQIKKNPRPQIQGELNNKYQKHQYRVLMGESGKYFASGKSSLYFFEIDGRCGGALGRFPSSGQLRSAAAGIREIGGAGHACAFSFHLCNG
jgi:20S proteasome alpha/beta subunit